MPRYFFTVEDGLCLPDFGGTELCDVNAARAEAVLRCQTFIAEQPKAFAAGGPWRMDVSDEWGVLLFRHPFAAKKSDPKGGA
jgi:hypothetical protein